MKPVKLFFRNINWKLLNFTVYIEILLSYFLPYKIVNESQYQIGFPFPFLTIYNKPIIHINPYQSMHLHDLNLLIDLILLYVAFSSIRMFYSMIRKKSGK